MTRLRHNVTLSVAKGLLASIAIIARPAAAQEPGSNLQVYLMTMGAGADIEERFGHNAIWIRDTVAHSDLIYNFGTYDFPRTVPGLIAFGAEFAMGPPRYWLGVDRNLDNELSLYQSRQRDLSAQELNLTPAQRADLAARLAVNARDENKYYLYDYFRDNCSTRVRDILDLELGGALKRATLGKPADGTLRFHTRRSITNDKLLYFGIDLAFGPRVDRPLDQWDEMFLPEKVAAHVNELTVPGADGKPDSLVKRSFSLLTIGAYHVEPAPPAWGGFFLAIGLVVAALIKLASARGRVAMVGRVIGGAWMLSMGIGGLVLLAFWIVTQHVATWQNHNLLIVSPLAFGLVSTFWHRRDSIPGRWTQWIARVLIGSVAFGALFAIFPSVGGQENLPIALLTTPPTLIGALIALNRRS